MIWLAAIGLLAPPTSRTIAALPPEATAGRGAALPFVEYEAENAATNGTMIGPDRRFTTLAAEASGRRAVRLDQPGAYVEFVLARPANAMTVRAAIPDSADGAGRDAALDVLIDGRRAATIGVTSRYGWYYGRYPFTNEPADGRAHHFYDESHLLFGRTLSAGTHVRLRVPSTDAAPWYAIDLADFEQVPPPLRRPRRSVSVVDMGADPHGMRSSRIAFDRAIAIARQRGVPVWIPVGTFRIEGHVIVDDVSILGAGPWYSIVRGPRLGFYGKPAPGGSRDVRLEDFAIIGDVRERKDDDQVNGIGGAMSRSLIRDLFIQHEKVGLWFDGPMDDIRIERLRITDTMADGLNFHRGVSHAAVTDTFIRNTGDDGLAAWSEGVADHDIVFSHNTIVEPILANGIAIYGGHDISVRDNLIADTLTEGGGLHVGNRFKAVPLSGRIALDDNVIVRGGSVDPNWGFGVGALWFYALDAPMTATIDVAGDRLIDSSEEATLFIGEPITDVSLRHLDINRANGPAITLRSDGAAMLAGSRATGVAAPAVATCGVAFRLSDGGDNHGFGKTDAQACRERRE